MTSSLADAARHRPTATIVQTVRAGDWGRLATTLTAEPKAGDDGALLACLATGRCGAEPPPLPSYRLLREIGPA
ncbi:MAG: hypothetical protein JO021_10840, partial [Alphaproteobacteria bacterium]|nr:hypothetical protein [Alphaproteobacteria bacterium]